MTKVVLCEQSDDGLCFYHMQSDSVEMTVTNLGCRILTLKTMDRMHNMEDIVLSYRNVRNCMNDDSCMGAIAGRVANRIGNASFILNGREYFLKANCGPHHLHGGERGFDKVLFDGEIIEDGIRFFYCSPDGEEGYPGRLELTVTYLLTDNRVRIMYEAQADRDTIVNVTNHTYFNLSGHNPEGAKEGFPEKIEGHRMCIKAECIACVDSTGLAAGEILPVQDTPFDFLSPHYVGERIHADHPQIQNAGGYDHSFFLMDDEEDQIILSHEKSGRRLRIHTTLPVVQVYTSNFLAGGVDGKHGLPYENREGIALETQYLSNSIQIEKEPKVILRAGEKRCEETIWTFDVTDK